MQFTLNRKSLERLKALVRAGKYVDRAWSFSAADSNQLLGDPPNWSEYQQWFLGIGIGVPPDGSTDVNQTWQKTDFAYPFGKGDVVNLAALRSIAKTSEADIADAAQAVLATAEEKIEDAKVASGKACDIDITFGAPAKIKAAAAKAGPPTFHAICYTGVPMILEGFAHPVVIDYDGADFTNKSRPVLRDHDTTRPIGHTTQLGVVGPNIEADGEISFVSQDAKEVADSGKNNFPWQISVGAKVLKTQFIPEGDTAQANGKTWSGPVIIARNTSFREISFLTLGADDNTSAQIAATAAKGSRMKFKKKFVAWAKSRNIKMEDMADDAVAKAAKEMYKAQMKCEADDAADEDASDEDMKDGEKGDDDKKNNADSSAAQLNLRAAANSGGNPASQAVLEMRAAMLTERQRVTKISATLEEYRPQISAEKFATIEAAAISGEYDLNKTELECIKARRPAVSAPYINTGAGGQPDGMIIAAAACRAAGLSEKNAYYGLDERAGNIAASMKALSIHGILAMSASRIGMHAHPGGIDDDFLAEFLPRDKASHRQQIQAARAGGMIRASSGAGFSTMSLTGITENILYKAMLEAYTLQDSVVGEIAFETDTNDFKIYKRYRLTGSGQFQPIGPAGELKAFSLQDESYPNQVKTMGVLLVLKREDIIDDDMGALMQAPQAVGEEGAQNREQLVLSAFLSGPNVPAIGPSVGKSALGFNFFSAGAKNYQSGAGSALGLASLTVAAKQFLEQKNANNRPIGVRPTKVLVSPANKVVAEGLFNGVNLIAAGYQLPAETSGSSEAQSASQTTDWNAHKGRYTPVVSPYLSSQFIGNDTQWALLPNPAGGKATVQVGYLRGQRTPIIRQVDTDAAILGIAYQAIQDIGVALMDYRMGQYSNGQ